MTITMINIWISVVVILTIIFWLFLDIIIENFRTLKHDPNTSLKITTTILVIAEFATIHCIIYAVQQIF